jgi:TolB protein
MRVVSLAFFVPALLAAQQPGPPVINGGLPSVNPKTSQIAFLSSRDGRDDLYLVNPDGSGLQRLTNDATRKSFGTWSADGKTLVYSSGNMDSTQVFAVEAHEGGKRLLRSFAGYGPSFSNDGRSMVYAVGRMPQSTTMISALDGSNSRRWGTDNTTKFNFAWSPDDKLLAYTTLAADSTRALSVWVANADGTNARRVSQIAPAEGSPQWPAWSLDGKRLAIQVGKYSRDRATNTAHIWVIDVASAKATKLAPHDRAYLDETPSWLPDGKHIAFQSDRTGRMEIWIMNDDGTGARQITK